MHFTFTLLLVALVNFANLINALPGLNNPIPPPAPTSYPSGTCQQTQVKTLLKFANSVPPYSEMFANDLCSFARKLDPQFCPVIKASTKTVTGTTTVTSTSTVDSTTGTTTVTTTYLRRNVQTMGQLFSGKWPGAPPPAAWNQCPIAIACDFCRCLDGELTQSTTTTVTATITSTVPATTTVSTAAQATKTCPSPNTPLSTAFPLPAGLSCADQNYFALRFVTCSSQVGEDNGQLIGPNENDGTFESVLTRSNGIFYLDNSGQLHAINPSTNAPYASVLSIIEGGQGSAPSFTINSPGSNTVFYAGYPLETAAGGIALTGCTTTGGKFTCPPTGSNTQEKFGMYEASQYNPLYLVRFIGPETGANYYIQDAMFDVINLCPST